MTKVMQTSTSERGHAGLIELMGQLCLLPSQGYSEYSGLHNNQRVMNINFDPFPSPQ